MRADYRSGDNNPSPLRGHRSTNTSVEFQRPVPSPRPDSGLDRRRRTRVRRRPGGCVDRIAPGTGQLSSRLKNTCSIITPVHEHQEKSSGPAPMRRVPHLGRSLPNADRSVLNREPLCLPRPPHSSRVMLSVPDQPRSRLLLANLGKESVTGGPICRVPHLQKRAACTADHRKWRPQIMRDGTQERAPHPLRLGVDHSALPLVGQLIAFDGYACLKCDGLQ
jgi:hypothetical protein